MRDCSSRWSDLRFLRKFCGGTGGVYSTDFKLGGGLISEAFLSKKLFNAIL